MSISGHKLPLGQGDKKVTKVKNLAGPIMGEDEMGMISEVLTVA